MKATVINNLKHNGVQYTKGQTFEGEKELVEQLIKAGALRDKNAVETADETDAQVLVANATAEAAKIIEDAKAKAKDITDSAKSVADDIKKAAKEAGEKAVEDAKAKAAAAQK